MATADEILKNIQKITGGQTYGQSSVKQPSSGTPVSFDIKTYQPGSTANAGSTTQQKQTPQQIINQATGGYSGGSTKLPNQSLAPQTGQQIVSGIVGNLAPNQGSTFNPNQNQYPGMSFGGTNTSQAQGGYTYVPPPLSKQESVGVAKNYGLGGLADNKFTGMTQSQADKAAKDLQEKYKAQTSAGTSYTYNPQSIAGFNEKIGSLKTKVDDINNSVWTSSGDKKTNTDATIKSYTNQLAGLFNTPEEFQNALNTNPEFDKSVSEYQRMGGDVNAITSAISQKSKGLTVVGTRDNPDGTTTNFLSDGTQSTGKLTPNADGTYSFNETDGGFQTLDQYLGRISTPEEKKAYQSLIPEQKSLQAQIAFENGIVEKYKDYYFGDEKQIGLIQQKKQMAIEKANILDQQAKLAADNAKAQADLLVQKDKADMEAADAEIEENQITAKNYMTGMLAKLGALNTTGAAGEALVNLDIKYQKQKQANKVKYGMMMRETEVKLNETLNNIDSKKMESIFTIKEDLSKDEETIMKDIFKLETDATRKSFDAVDKYLGMYRTQKDKYIKEAKDAAEKAAKAAAATMSNYNLSNLTFANYLQAKGQGGEQTTIGGKSPIGGMNVTTGGQSINPATSASFLPGYREALTNMGGLSPATQSILSGEKTEADYAKSSKEIRNTIKKELAVIGRDVLPQPKPQATSLLKEAKTAIDSGADAQAVKQRFLEAYPDKSALWKSYFE